VIAGQGKRMKKSNHTHQHLCHKVRIIVTLSWFTVLAHFDREFFKDVQGNSSDDREVFSRIILPRPIGIFVEYYV
jgi:hypothetical protein